jgi:hypothetical protein
MTCYTHHKKMAAICCSFFGVHSVKKKWKEIL